MPSLVPTRSSLVAGTLAILALGLSVAFTASASRNVVVLASRDNQQPAYAIFMHGLPARDAVRADLGPQGAYVADSRELRRFALHESNLPAGSVVHPQRPSLWDEYHWHIVVLIVTIIAQAVLIIALIVQRRRRHSAELEVQRQRSELLHASRLTALGELSAFIAHEVNQPLGAIAGNADAVELLLDADPPKLDDARRVLLDLKRANQRASEVVNKIRGLLSRRELQFEPYDINAVAYDVVRLVDSDATLRGIQLWSQLGPVPLVHGDRLHLQQVLLNLLMNGMDSMEGMPVGQRHLTLTTASTDTGDAQITVTDTGRGIDKADLPRLFNSFFTTKANGMGLGLALCRSIVQAHGGNISAHNNPDGGASFAITLPIDATQRAH